MSGSRDQSGEDLYDALGVGAGASDEEITRAYRRLAREHHPDANPHAEGAAFADLTDAYDVLHDADRRQVYDETRRVRGEAARSAASVRIPVHHITTPVDRRGSTSPQQHPPGHAPTDSEF